MMKMKLEEAIIYVLASSGHGMTTERLAESINKQALHIRKDGQPVTASQIYATVRRFPHIFAREGGRILLYM